MWEKSKGITKYEKRIVTCNVATAQWENRTVKCEKKNKGTTECDKRTITCDVGTRQCEDRTVKCEKKVRKPPKSHCDKRTVTCDKNRAYMMLVVFNMTIKPLNLRKNEKKK